MLSIAPLRCAAYYLDLAQERGELFAYYADERASSMSPAGKWTGKLAARLGLTAGGADVKRADFEALFHGFDPRSGAALQTGAQSIEQAQAVESAISAAEQKLFALNRKAIAAKKAGQDELAKSLQELAALARADLKKAERYRRRPGSDLTFSAPKSASLLWAKALKDDPALARRIEQAHDAAVSSAAEIMERGFLMSRRRDLGSQRQIREFVKGAIIAMFRHGDARAVKGELPDPQLHTHVLLLSPVLRADDEIGAAYTDYAKDNLKALGAAYRAHFAQALRGLGCSLEADEQKSVLALRVAGIGEKAEKAFSKRREKILETVRREGIDEQTAALKLRQAKENWSQEELVSGWNNALDALDVSLDAVTRAKGGASPRMRSDEELVESLLELETFFSLPQLRQALWEDAQFDESDGPLLEERVNARLRRILKSPDLLMVQDPRGQVAPGQKRRAFKAAGRFNEPIFTTNSLVAREERNLRELRGMTDDARHAVDLTQAQRSIAAFEQRSGMRLHDYQLAPVLGLTTAKTAISICAAWAGAGKTTMATAAKAVWEDAGFKLVGLAPSNKAAAKLGEETGMSAYTLERLFKLVEETRPGQERVELDDRTVLFVDEASMVGFDNAEKLTRLAREYGCKIALVGDPDQLPSVSKGVWLRSIMNDEAIGGLPRVLSHMTKDFGDWKNLSRQREAWAKQASAHAALNKFGQALELYEERGCLTQSVDRAEQIEKIATEYMADTRPPVDKLVMATKNDDVWALNQAIREALKQAGKLKEPQEIADTALELCPRDRIIFTETLRPKGRGAEQIAKSETGTVVCATPRPDGSLDLTIELDRKGADGAPGVARFNTNDFSSLAHGYALTVHRSQGQTVESAWFLYSNFVSHELAYVAMTRHRANFKMHVLDHEREDLEARLSNKLFKVNARDLVPDAGADGKLSAAFEQLRQSCDAEERRQDALFASALDRAGALALHAIGRAKEAATSAAEGARLIIEALRQKTAGAAPVLLERIRLEIEIARAKRLLRREAAPSLARHPKAAALDAEGLRSIQQAGRVMQMDETGIVPQTRRVDLARESILPYVDERYIYVRDSAGVAFALAKSAQLPDVLMEVQELCERHAALERTRHPASAQDARAPAAQGPPSIHRLTAAAPEPLGLLARTARSCDNAGRARLASDIRAGKLRVVAADAAFKPDQAQATGVISAIDDAFVYVSHADAADGALVVKWPRASAPFAGASDADVTALLGFDRRILLKGLRGPSLSELRGRLAATDFGSLGLKDNQPLDGRVAFIDNEALYISAKHPASGADVIVKVKRDGALSHINERELRHLDSQCRGEKIGIVADSAGQARVAVFRGAKLGVASSFAKLLELTLERT
jgi:conjugative relaxase-like TrwC/TraI family protein